MNPKIICHTIGIVMIAEAAFMLPVVIYALFSGEDPMPFIYSIAIPLSIGIPLSLLTRSKGLFYAKNAMVAVVLAWLSLSFFGALPYLFCSNFDSFIDCLFESVSGFSTTGGSIFPSVAHLPKTVLLWRNLTVFWGGMGVLVFASIIFPSSKDRSHNLMRAESTGPMSTKFVPKLSTSSKILYSIYFVLTILHTICLICVDIAPFDAVNIALSTAGTGGFAIIDGGISSYNNSAAEIIISIFMLLSSINYAAYFLLVTGRLKELLHLSEVRFYLLVIAVCVLLVAANINSIYSDVGTSLKYAFFTVVSFSSTTGFNVVDHDTWPMFSKAIIFLLMAVGGCAASTSGGIKMSRILITLKLIKREVTQTIYPRSVNIVRMNGHIVEEKTLASVTRFFAAYVVIASISFVLLSIDNFDFMTSLTAVVTCMTSSAPGFGLVGPVGCFDIFSGFSKIVLMMCMLIGRLEIFPILIFLSPSTWKNA